MYVAPLGPDRCRDDRCAVCAYWHLKVAALSGYQLSHEQLELIGVVNRHRSTDGGWRQPDTDAYEVASILSADDLELLTNLMNVGHAD